MLDFYMRLLPVAIAASNNDCVLQAGTVATHPHRENTMAPSEGFPYQHCVDGGIKQNSFLQPVVAEKKVA